MSCRRMVSTPASQQVMVAGITCKKPDSSSKAEPITVGAQLLYLCGLSANMSIRDKKSKFIAGSGIRVNLWSSRPLRPTALK